MTPTAISAVLLLLLLLLFTSDARPHKPTTSTAKSQPSNRSSESCDGRRIHIVPLPSRFNTDLLLTVDSFPLMSPPPPLSPYLPNHALGPRTHNRSRSWFRTDPLLLEPLFHRRLLEYPCLSRHPSDADALFLPYYASLDALPFLFDPPLFNSSATHGLALSRHLSSHGLLSRHDLFLVSARPAVDLSQDPATDPPLFGTSFLQIPDFLNLTVLTVESRPSPWQEHAIPYPTSFHPATLARLDAWLARARSSKRTNLMLFVGGGGGGGPSIRGSIRSECENRTDLCEIVDCSNGICAHDPLKFMRPMLRSTFCLQPPGDTPTRRSTFDGILAGCIPVFFEEISARAQYGWHLPKGEYGQFSVTIPKEEVVYGGMRIWEVLEAIGGGEVRRMREKVLEMAPRVMYRRHGSSDGLRQRKDAFDLAIEGVLRRVRRRVRAAMDPALLYGEEDDDDL